MNVSANIHMHGGDKVTVESMGPRVHVMFSSPGTLGCSVFMDPAKAIDLATLLVAIADAMKRDAA